MAMSKPVAPNLGVDRPCYGEYNCNLCHRKWASNKAWRDFGQKCSRCENVIQAVPGSLKALFYYDCKNCEIVWKTKFIQRGMPCKNCRRMVKPVTYNEFRKAEIGKSDSYFDPAKKPEEKAGHRQDLCEKCKRYGKSCILVAQETNRQQRERDRQQQLVTSRVTPATSTTEARSTSYGNNVNTRRYGTASAGVANTTRPSNNSSCLIV